ESDPRGHEFEPTSDLGYRRRASIPSRMTEVAAGPSGCLGIGALFSPAMDRRQPRLGSVGFDRDLEINRFDRLDRPAVGKCASELGRRHPAWPPVAGLPIAEAHQVTRAARLKG